MKKLYVLALSVVLVSSLILFAQETEKKTTPDKRAGTMASGAHIAVVPADMQWGDAPPSLPAGAKLAVLEGDPGKSGMFTIRGKFPANYKIMPHWHPTTERVTVISGTFHVGAGDKFDDSAGTALTAGGYGMMPAKMHHYAWTTEDTEIQVSGMGPFKVIYVNPADDPSKTQK